MSDEAHFAGKLIPDNIFEEHCRMEFISSIFADIAFHLKQFYGIKFPIRRKKALKLSDQDLKHDRSM